MRHVRRHEDEVPLARLGDKLQLVAPPHARAAFDDVDDRLEVAVVVGAGFGVRVDLHGAGPEFLGAAPGACGRDGGGAGLGGGKEG